MDGKEENLRLEMRSTTEDLIKADVPAKVTRAEDAPNPLALPFAVPYRYLLKVVSLSKKGENVVIGVNEWRKPGNDDRPPAGWLSFVEERDSGVYTTTISRMY